MAIITHRTSKNAAYNDVLEYYSFKHKEDQRTGHYELVLDEYGLRQERDNYAVTYITAQGEEAEPELWAAACMRTNLLFQKNMERRDRKSHEYIISHPVDDRARMTMDDLLEEGRAFVRENLPGYDALIGVHRDTENDHIHISINSVRALRREQEQDWMMRDKTGQVLDCEMEAGGKHQDSPGLRKHMNDWLLDYTRQHGLVEKDNNAIAEKHRIQRHGDKNDQMRAALLGTARKSKDMKDLCRNLKEEYGMGLKVSKSGNTISVLYPGNQKYVRLRTLGLEVVDLTRCFAGETYISTNEAEQQQRRKETEVTEERKYAEWLKQVRQKNNERAERMILRSEELLDRELRGRGERYVKEEFQDLRYLIRQTSYVAGNLQTELEKVDRLLGRWEQYHDDSLPGQERWKHGGYIRWCGCDPDSLEELTDLKAEREVILAQQNHAQALHQA